MAVAQYQTCHARLTWLVGVSLLALAAPAAAQDQSAPTSAQPDIAKPDEPKPAPANARDIVVVGNAALPASLKDIQVEQIYDPDRINSYGVSTIGELLDGITGENGDSEPQILINGQPVRNSSDIADLPVEAVARIEELPRGSATRIGGAPGQRAYNVVLRSDVRSVTLAASYQAATEGGWDNLRTDGTVTYIHQNDRVNLTARGGWSGNLLESERAVTPLVLGVPYSPLGNVVGLSGGEIDPALSLLAGRIVTVAGVPVGAANPGLAAFAATADQANPSDLARYRSLRGSSQPYEVSLTANKVLSPWLEVAINGRLGWTSEERLNGLPSARFLLPAGHPNSPFSRNVALALSDPARPLHGASSSNTVVLGVTFNATFGEWRATLASKYDDRSRTYSYDLTGSIPGGLITIPAANNPFTTPLAGLIPITTTQTSTANNTREVQGDVEGPLLALPAGPLRLRAGLGATWLSLDGASTTGVGERHFRRHEYELRGGLSIPLTAAPGPGARGFGASEFTVDASTSDLGSYGRLDSLALALTWQPAAWLRLTASQASEQVAPSPDLLAYPTTITPNVRYFDPVTGNTTEVTLITGGSGNLASERRRVRHVTLTASPWKAHNLQLTADFLVSDVRNQYGALPLPTPAVLAAFPDRFVRDSNGQLTLVDSRTVNFARQSTTELRSGISFTVPLAKPAKPQPRRAGDRAVMHAPSRPVLQVNASFTHVFSSTTTIRDTLGPIDLLAGGVIGLFGGRPRNSADASVTLSDRGIGLRTGMIYRGPSLLATGTALAPDRLRFAPFVKFDLKLYADAAQLLGPSPLTRGLRLSVSVENVTNSRQGIANLAGLVPQGYQPIYRDPLGRIVSVELRKVF